MTLTDDNMNITSNFHDVHTSGLAASLVQTDALHAAMASAVRAGLTRDTPTAAIECVYAMVEDLMDTQAKRGVSIKRCTPQLQIMRVLLIFQAKQRSFRTGSGLFDAIRNWLKNEAESILPKDQFEKHIKAYEELKHVSQQPPAGSA